MSFIMETVPADAAFLAIAGRYYVRRCNDMDPEESLQDGTKGPASFARATGALLLEAPNFCNPRATITMKGIANTATGADYTSELSPPWNGPAKRLDGKFTFQMDVERLKLFGDLKLRISRKVDANGDAILVGDYLFQEGDKDTDKEWNERVRCFRAPADTDDWPEALAPRAPLASVDLVGDWISKHGDPAFETDLFFVVTEGGEETRIPACAAVLKINCAMIRDLPEAGDVPVIGDHSARTVVQFLALCYPFLGPGTKRPADFTFDEISGIARFAHWCGAPNVIDQLGQELEARAAGLERAARQGYRAPMSLNRELFMTAFILGDLGRPVQFLDYVLEWPEFFFSLSHRAPFLKYAGPVFEQFIGRAADKLRDGSRPALLGLFERVALYLLRPDAGLVPPPPPSPRRYAGSVRKHLPDDDDA